MRDAARVGFAPLTHDATGVGKVAAARVLPWSGGGERAGATPTILDLTMRQLSAPAAVWSTVARRDVSMQLDRLLGDCLKNVPASTSPTSEGPSDGSESSNSELGHDHFSQRN
jgi:hypothetical protein